MSALGFKTAAQNNDLDAFYDLWDQPNNLMLKLEALRWACAFDREEMIDCVLDSKELDTTDVTVAFKEATRHKSLNALGQLLRWSQWGNRFGQEHVGIPCSKYINEIGHTAMVSDWSAVFETHRVRFKSLSYVDSSQLYLRGVREGAVACLKAIDNGAAGSNWYESFKAALTALQSKSLQYLLEHPNPFDQAGQHKKAVEGAANLVADPYLFLNQNAVDCVMVLMNFVSPQEICKTYPRFSQPRLAEVLDKVVSMHQKKLLNQAIEDTVDHNTPSAKRKM